MIELSKMTEEQLKPFEQEYAKKRSARLDEESKERARIRQEANDACKRERDADALRELASLGVTVTEADFLLIQRSVLDQLDYYEAAWIF